MSKKFVSNKNETIRLFENDILEALSRVHYSVPIILYIPVITYFIFISFSTHQLSALTVIGLFAGGFALWSIFEYLVHRFIFHYPVKSKIGKQLHFLFHGIHHDYPNDSKRLVMPPSVSIPLFFFFYFVYLYTLGPSLMFSFYAGFIMGYLVYDITHYAVHHFNIKNKYWLKIKKHHMLHHYQDEHKGYGVSSPLWDRIFSTDFPKKKKS